MRLTLSLFGITGLLALGQVADPRNLSGRWELQSRNNEPATGMTLEIEQDGDELKMHESAKSEKDRIEIKCETRGVECSLKAGGKDLRVSYYYNGPTLVETLWSGKEVTKTRRTLSEDGTKLIVEVMPMSPPKDADKLIFTRVEHTAAK